jgi:hypothetical protein
MATIIEDYVSFEIAKLLKEKGFIIPLPKDWVFCMYDKSGNTQWGCYHSDWYPRITLQMAMKWLREVHNLVIQVGLIDFLEHGEVWLYSVIERKTIKQLTSKDEDSIEHSYEEACESAIKYCLEHLI